MVIIVAVHHSSIAEQRSRLQFATMHGPEQSASIGFPQTGASRRYGYVIDCTTVRC